MKFTPLLFFLFCKKSLVQVTQNKVEFNESSCNLTYLLSESELFISVDSAFVNSFLVKILQQVVPLWKQIELLLHLSEDQGTALPASFLINGTRPQKQVESFSHFLRFQGVSNLTMKILLGLVLSLGILYEAGAFFIVSPGGYQSFMVRIAIFFFKQIKRNKDNFRLNIIDISNVPMI